MPNFVLAKDIIETKNIKKNKNKRYEKLQQKKIPQRTKGD